MNNLERELEQSFLKLPTLNHAGIALLQFARYVFKTSLQKKPSGIFMLGFVGFSFPNGKEMIRLHVKLEIQKIDAQDLRCLPLEFGEDFLMAEVTYAGQLGCAARYIEMAHQKQLAVQPPPPNSYVTT